MRRVMLWIAAWALVVGGGGCRQPVAEHDGRPQGGAAVGNLYIATPVRHGNLTIFPVYSRVAKNDDRFITLDEGLKAGTIEVRETGAVSDDALAPSLAEEPSNISQQPAEADSRKPSPFDDSLDLFGPQAPAAQAVSRQGARHDESPSTPAPDHAGESPRPADPVDELFPQDETPSPNRGGVSGNVNQLVVINRSDRPLYLMPGEVIVGGQQDRTIGQEIVVAPGGKPTPIDAFCVEHGRWRGRSSDELAALGGALGGFRADAAPMADTTAIHVAPLIVTEALAGNWEKEANEGKFNVSAGALNSKARLEVQGSKSQSGVWREVAKTNAASGGGNIFFSSTGGFTGNYVDRDVVSRLAPYIKQLQEPVAGQDRVVGVIVAVDERIVTMDVFESTPLFKKLWPKLLKSYALDAATAAQGAGNDVVVGDDLEEGANSQAPMPSGGHASDVAARPTKIQPVSVADARTFLAEAMTGKAEEVETKDGLTVTRREGQYCVSFSAHDGQVPYATSVIPAVEERGEWGSLGGAAPAAGVHTSAFGK